MALTNLEKWIGDRLEWLTPRHAASLRRAVNADIKELLQTDVQKLKAEIAPHVERTFELLDSGDIITARNTLKVVMAQLSAV